MIRDSISQSPRDRILWILSSSGGKMERSTLRRRVGMRLADLEPILGELAREGRIGITGEEKGLVAILEMNEEKRPGQR